MDGLRHRQYGESRRNSYSPDLRLPRQRPTLLHYVSDLWVCSWRRKHAHGEVYVVRYADDLVAGFQRRRDAIVMHRALTDRVAKFGLQLHPDKTRVLEFGRFSLEERARRGLSKPATFEFLGFLHIMGKSRGGKAMLRRRTSRQKRQAKLVRLKEELRRRRHRPVAEQHAWLSQVLEGQYRYYGVPTNHRALAQFRRRVVRLWRRSLERRSQRAGFTLARWRALLERFPLPEPRIMHPWPDQRFATR